MNFSKEHILVRQLAKDFAERELTDEVLDKAEAEGVFPQSLIKKMADAGFYGIKVPQKYGGQGADHVAYVIVMEEIAKKSGVASVYVSGPNSLTGTPVLNAGTEEQKQKYLRGMITGDHYMCFGLTEPGAGSDSGGLATTAKKVGDNYVLNGRKTFITAAPISKYAVVFAKTNPAAGTRGISAFFVDLEAEGVSFGKPEDKMGIIGCPTSDIVLENVVVPASEMLGKENRGFAEAMKALDTGRIGIAAQSIGIAAGAFEEALKFAKERKQFGRSISNFQGIKFMLADMATELETARAITYEAARAKDAGEDTTKLAAIAKLYASEACNRICAKAVQIHGGYGYIKDYKVERFYRDARITTIYEGTSQILQVVIAGALLK